VVKNAEFGLRLLIIFSLSDLDHLDERTTDIRARPRPDPFFRPQSGFQFGAVRLARGWKGSITLTELSLAKPSP
jgi:hypothetical protein